MLADGRSVRCANKHRIHLFDEIISLHSADQKRFNGNAAYFQTRIFYSDSFAAGDHNNKTYYKYNLYTKSVKIIFVYLNYLTSNLPKLKACYNNDYDVVLQDVQNLTDKQRQGTHFSVYGKYIVFSLNIFYIIQLFKW